MEKMTTSQIHTTPLPHREGQGGGSDESLISEVFQRRELLADLDRMIIADVRRQARRAWLRRWARVAIFSFGLPLALLVFFVCAYLYIKEYAWTPQSFFIMLWPTLALLFSTVYAIRTFSPEEV